MVAAICCAAALSASWCQPSLQCCCRHRDLPSFPTRRSSDLLPWASKTITRHPSPDVGQVPSCLEVSHNPQMSLGHLGPQKLDRKSTRLNSSHLGSSYAVFCLQKKKNTRTTAT